jgi:gliding motility-associated-like protein
MVLIAAQHGYSQSLYNQTVISITPNTVLYVHDTLVNSGLIVNNGDLQIGGSWINNNQYDAGQGQITFNSNLPQIINHNDQAFSKLTISGGGEKIFGANITIEKELVLSGGTLVSDNNAAIIFQKDAVVTGASDNSHIVGKVIQHGSGTKTYPLGNGETYLPVTLANISGTDAQVGLQLFELNGTVLKKATRLQSISDKRYWQLDVISGSVENAEVTLPIHDEDGITGEGSPVVAQSGSVSEEFQSLGQSSLNDDFVTSSNPITLTLLAVGTELDDDNLNVYNAVSPNGDGKNEFMTIDNIEMFPDNKLVLYNRWGDEVFSISNYDNNTRVFKGLSPSGKVLPAGTYYYKINYDGRTKTGYVQVEH